LYNSSEEVVNRLELISGKRPAFYKLDITDESALDKVFDEHPDIDNVIHFAALKVGEWICPKFLIRAPPPLFSLSQPCHPFEELGH
jgi:nucleoside-diphosphate-sugar epimerase